MFKDLPAEVHEMGQMHFEGNIVPEMWYNNIKFEKSGKVDLVSITLLSEICYWYRPTYLRDENSGKVVAVKKKFKADALQKSKKSLADKFGFTERQVKDSLERLESMGFIHRDYRTIVTSQGIRMSNILFIKIFPKKIQQATFEEIDTYDVETSDPQRSNVTRPTFQRQAHLYTTKNTTKTTTKKTPPNPQKGEADKSAKSEISSKNLKDYSTTSSKTSNSSNKHALEDKKPITHALTPKKKDIAPKQEYESFGKFVKLKPGEYESFCEKYNKKSIDLLIEEMNDYCAASKPKGYNDYAAALRQWISRRKNLNSEVVDSQAIEKNKKLAEVVENRITALPNFKKKIVFAALSDCVEISEGPYKKPIIIKYSENGFKEQLMNLLDKYDLLKYIKK